MRRVMDLVRDRMDQFPEESGLIIPVIWAVLATCCAMGFYVWGFCDGRRHGREQSVIEEVDRRVEMRGLETDRWPIR